MSNVMAMQRRQDRIGSIIPGLLSTAGSIVGGAYGGPAGAAAGGKVGGAVGGAVAEPNKQPATVGGAGAIGQSSPGASGRIDPAANQTAMQRRMAESQTELANAEAALKDLTPEQQKTYGPTIQNARRYERSQGGY